MNFKLLPIVAFIGWAAICWRWYVCEIKKVCKGSNPTASTISTPAGEPSSTAVDSVTSLLMAEDGVGTTKTSGQEQLPSKPAIKTERPSSAASDVDINSFSVVEEGELITIHFPYNSVVGEKNEDAEAFLISLAAQLNQSKRKLVITGHTDSVGDGVSNEKIALLRAKNIRDKLISLEVATSQITCQTYGERKPIATNDHPQGRYKNRRVEFLLK